LLSAQIVLQPIIFKEEQHEQQFILEIKQLFFLKIIRLDEQLVQQLKFLQGQRVKKQFFKKELVFIEEKQFEFL
jgi:hypothetical protein